MFLSSLNHSLWLPFFSVSHSSVLSHLLLMNHGGLSHACSSLLVSWHGLWHKGSLIQTTAVWQNGRIICSERKSLQAVWIWCYRAEVLQRPWIRRFCCCCFGLWVFFPVLLLGDVNVYENYIVDFWEMLFIVFWG